MRGVVMAMKMARWAALSLPTRSFVGVSASTLGPIAAQNSIRLHEKSVCPNRSLLDRAVEVSESGYLTETKTSRKSQK
jgi:hypothetical protein